VYSHQLENALFTKLL